MDRVFPQALTTLITEARATGAVFLLGFVQFPTWTTDSRGEGVGFPALAVSPCGLGGAQLPEDMVETLAVVEPLAAQPSRMQGTGNTAAAHHWGVNQTRASLAGEGSLRSSTPPAESSKPASQARPVKV